MSKFMDKINYRNQMTPGEERLKNFILILTAIGILWALTYFQLWTYVFIAAISGLGLLFGGYGGHPER